jgi:hypothetical protein
MDCFERRVLHMPDDLGPLYPPKRAFSRLVEKVSRSEPLLFWLHRGGKSDLKSATSGLRHQSSRWE